MNTQALISPLVVLAVLLVAVYFFPWSNVNWGTINMQPSEVITVTGYADSQESNRQATFTAGVTAVNDDKQVAVDEVSTKIEEIIAQVKAFGIEEADIKTQNMSIYQNQEMYYEGSQQRSRFGQWNVSNNIEIVLRDIKRVDDLSRLLSSSPANNVWGPNLSTGDSREAQKALLAAAVEDARAKAEEAAKATGKTLGKTLSIVESGSGYGVYPAMFDRGMGGGGGIPIEPGTSTVSQSVTVTFELN